MQQKLSLVSLKKELKKSGTSQKAKASAWFFKTGAGEYGEGDVFIGVTLPEQRTIASRYKESALPAIEELLHSKEHEFRMTALLILLDQWRKADPALRKKIHALYLRNTQWVNNWDLVDVSASTLVGEYLEDKNKTLLEKLAVSKSLWERRIAMIATYAYIKKGESKYAFAVADILLFDEHDLIQKAVGWMLREAGKRCGQKTLEVFLKKRYKKMPRTMLRYAIERFRPDVRKRYLQGHI
jgi:3-methyladenine DNA glycosylase AlkD